jgi:hypothetical protein
VVLAAALLVAADVLLVVAPVLAPVAVLAVEAVAPVVPPPLVLAPVVVPTLVLAASVVPASVGVQKPFRHWLFAPKMVSQSELAVQET